MNVIYPIKPKLKSIIKQKSSIRSTESKSRVNYNESFDPEISIINEKNVFSSKNKKEKITQKIHFNQVRLQKKGSLYNKSNENPRNNDFCPIMIRKLLPCLSNVYLENYMDYKETVKEKNDDSIEKETNTQAFEQKSELKTILLEDHNIEMEPIKKEFRLPKINIIADIHLQPNRNNFKVEIISKNSINLIDEKIFSIQRFNKHLEDELFSKLNIKPKRINKSLNNIPSSNIDLKKISSYNEYLSIKMSKYNRHKLLPKKLQRERGIQLLSRKFFENMKNDE